MNNFIAISRYDIVNTDHLIDIKLGEVQKRIYYSTVDPSGFDIKTSSEDFGNEADAIYAFGIINARLAAKGFLTVSPRRSINTKYIASIRYQEDVNMSGRESGTIYIDMIYGKTISLSTDSSFAEIARKLGI